jgi:spoIIIJ-associated protein
MNIQQFLTNICQHSGIEPESVEIMEANEDGIMVANITVSPEDSGLLIGFHGENLSAMQRVTRVVFQEELGDKRLAVNINQYREQRADKLKQLAMNAAERVLETGRPYRFSYLPANERFVVHSTISENPDYAELESISEGEGFHRVLIIRPRSNS